MPHAKVLQNCKPGPQAVAVVNEVMLLVQRLAAKRHELLMAQLFSW